MPKIMIKREFDMDDNHIDNGGDVKDQVEDMDDNITAADEIDINDLGDSQVCIRFFVSKKLLAEKSPVFREQFCGPMRQRKASASPECLELTDFSQDVYSEFFAMLADNTFEIYERVLGHCRLYLELLLLADRYQVKDLFTKLMSWRDEINITDDNVVQVAIAAKKYKDNPLCSNVCDSILVRCVRVVHYYQVNLYKNLINEEEYKDAVLYLAVELNKFQEKARACEHGTNCPKTPACLKKPVCRNCGTLPCLKARRVTELIPNRTYCYTKLCPVDSKAVLDSETLEDEEENQWKKSQLFYGCDFAEDEAEDKNNY